MSLCVHKWSFGVAAFRPIVLKYTRINVAHTEGQDSQTKIPDAGFGIDDRKSSTVCLGNLS